jgi:flagellar biosynthesis/type III secretory pathway protein FliH
MPRRRSILFDLSKLSESELPDDPETPELYAVLRIMQVIFSLDLNLRIREVLERFKPYSEIPKYRRLIRMLWLYFINYAKRQSDQEVRAITEAVANIIGEKEMSTILEQLKAEGIAEGEARGKAEGMAKGKVLAILEVRFNKVPQEIEDTIRSMTDRIALESLAEHAKSCKSLDEFAEAIR